MPGVPRREHEAGGRAPSSRRARCRHPPGAIRTFIGGILFLVVGTAVLFWGLQNWNAGRLGARVVGAGIVLLGMGVLSIFVGGFSILRDLIER